MTLVSTLSRRASSRNCLTCKWSFRREFSVLLSYSFQHNRNRTNNKLGFTWLIFFAINLELKLIDYWNRFSPEVVWGLDDEQIDRLGSEDNSTIQLRQELQEKLGVLENGLKDLDAFTARSSM